MKHILWKLGLVIFFLILSTENLECYGKEESLDEELFSGSAVLMDGLSGRILYEKNGQEFMANASTTKIMTCILALEMANLEDVVSVSGYAASMPDVQMHIREGEQYHLEDLLYALMLESYNDVAVAIAEHIAGSQEKFSDLMNQKAKSIGCVNTLFLTPNGLDATMNNKEYEANEEKRFHGTTARDLALIMRYCINISSQKEKFIEITSTSSYSFTNVEGDREFLCQNHNSLFQMMEGVISGKTGFTGKAGYCYVGAVEHDGKQYVLALLACGWPSNRNYKWQDCKTLINYGDNTYEKVDLEQVVKKYENEFYASVKEGIRNGLQEKCDVRLIRKNPKESYVLVKPEEKIHIKIHKKELMAPVEQGQIVGELIYYIDQKIWKKEWLYSEKNVEKINLYWSFRIILEKIV